MWKQDSSPRRGGVCLGGGRVGKDISGHLAGKASWASLLGDGGRAGTGRKGSLASTQLTAVGPETQG